MGKYPILELLDRDYSVELFFVPLRQQNVGGLMLCFEPVEVVEPLLDVPPLLCPNQSRHHD